VLFPQRLWAGLADGTVTLAFRRWRRPAARAGSVHHTPAGLLRIEAVQPVAERDITEAEARRAGEPSSKTGSWPTSSAASRGWTRAAHTGPGPH